MELRRQFDADPWFVPNANDRAIRVAARTGGFRGFGGLFEEPPRIASQGGDFLVRSGDACWLLTADAFGATLHRAPIEEFEVASGGMALPKGLRLSGSTAHCDGERFQIPLRGEITSVAANETTLAVTESLTHGIIFIALTPAP